MVVPGHEQALDGHGLAGEQGHGGDGDGPAGRAEHQAPGGRQGHAGHGVEGGGGGGQGGGQQEGGREEELVQAHDGVKLRVLLAGDWPGRGRAAYIPQVKQLYFCTWLVLVRGRGGGSLYSTLLCYGLSSLYRRCQNSCVQEPTT